MAPKDDHPLFCPLLFLGLQLLRYLGLRNPPLRLLDLLLHVLLKLAPVVILGTRLRPLDLGSEVLRLLSSVELLLFYLLLVLDLLFDLEEVFEFLQLVEILIPVVPFLNRT